MRDYFNSRGAIRSFGQGAFRYTYTRQSDPFGPDSDQGTGWAGGVGVDFFLSDHVAIEGMFGYDRFRLKGGDATGTVSLSFGVSAFVGGRSQGAVPNGLNRRRRRPHGRPRPCAA